MNDSWMSCGTLCSVARFMTFPSYFYSQQSGEVSLNWTRAWTRIRIRREFDEPREEFRRERVNHRDFCDVIVRQEEEREGGEGSEGRVEKSTKVCDINQRPLRTFMIVKLKIKITHYMSALSWKSALKCDPVINSPVFAVLWIMETPDEWMNAWPEMNTLIHSRISTITSTSCSRRLCLSLCQRIAIATGSGGGAGVEGDNQFSRPYEDIIFIVENAHKVVKWKYWK